MWRLKPARRTTHTHPSSSKACVKQRGFGMGPAWPWIFLSRLVLEKVCKSEASSQVPRSPAIGRQCDVTRAVPLGIRAAVPWTASRRWPSQQDCYFYQSSSRSITLETTRGGSTGEERLYCQMMPLLLAGDGTINGLSGRRRVRHEEAPEQLPLRREACLAPWPRLSPASPQRLTVQQ